MEIRLYSRIRIYIFRAYAGQHSFYSSFSSHAFIITSYTQSDLLIILPNVLCNNNYNFSILFFFWLNYTFFIGYLLYIYCLFSINKLRIKTPDFCKLHIIIIIEV